LPEMLNPYWGNPQLHPETGKSFEIGADLYLNTLLLGITYFDSTYKNLIGFSPVTARFANINKADILGVEISCNWELFKKLKWLGAYTYLHTHDVQYDRPLLRRPRHSLSSSLCYQTLRFSLAAEMVYVGKRLDYDELLWSVSENSPFNHFDLTVNVPLNKKISVFSRVSNVFNSHFEEVLGYPAPLRRILLGFKYQVAN
jgi:vitamin B12 transporter